MLHPWSASKNSLWHWQYQNVPIVAVQAHPIRHFECGFQTPSIVEPYAEVQQEQREREREIFSVRWLLHPVVVIGGIAIALYLLRETHVIMTVLRTTNFWRRAIPVYIAYKNTQRKTPLMPLEQAEAEWQKRHEHGSTELYRMCLEMKGMMLKAAQVFGSRSDFMPPQYVDKLSTLQDRVPPYDVSKVHDVLQQELGRPMEEVFEWVEAEPLGSASIAQVHKAMLRDTREVVAVKVQHAGAEQIMRVDLKNMRYLAEFLQRTDLPFDLVSVIRELEEQLPLEFDFVREADMMATMFERLEQAGLQGGIRFPTPYRRLVSRRVLVMSFLDGARILDVSRLDEMGVDRKAIAERIVLMYGHQILVDGLFHADAHPGNFLVLSDGSVAVLDFGQTKTLSDDLRLKLAAHMLALGSRQAMWVALTFAQLGIHIQEKLDISPETVMEIADSMFDTRKMPLHQISPFDENNLLKRHGVNEFPGELFMVLKNVQLLRGLFSSLDVDVSTVQLWRRFAWKALAGSGFFGGLGGGDVSRILLDPRLQELQRSFGASAGAGAQGSSSGTVSPADMRNGLDLLLQSMQAGMDAARRDYDDASDALSPHDTDDGDDVHAAPAGPTLPEGDELD